MALAPAFADRRELFLCSVAGDERANRAKGYSVLTRRKPIVLRRMPGERLYRYADRTFRASTYQLPPRATRLEPVPGPRGSVTGPAGYRPYQSAVHSHTFPNMSCNPHAFDRFCPTRCGCWSLFPQCHATLFNRP